MTPFHRSALLMIAFIGFLVPQYTWAQKKVSRKTQDINFAEMSLKGTVRNPEGAFLVQKRGIRFMPLYEVQKDMDSKIRESSEQVK